MAAKILTPALLVLLPILAMSCGDISLKNPSGVALTEPLPPGSTLVRQGTFTTSSSTITFTGSAQIYEGPGGDAILRLAGLNTNTPGLFAFVETSTDLLFHVAPLRATSGQANYRTGKSVGSSIFSRVVIRQTGNVNAPEVSSANLLPVQ